MGNNEENSEVLWGNRKFYDIPENFIPHPTAESNEIKNKAPGALVEYIETNCLGRDMTFSGPFGKREGLIYLN